MREKIKEATQASWIEVLAPPDAENWENELCKMTDLSFILSYTIILILWRNTKLKIVFLELDTLGASKVLIWGYEPKNNLPMESKKLIFKGAFFKAYPSFETWFSQLNPDSYVVISEKFKKSGNSTNNSPTSVVIIVADLLA